MPMVRKAEAGDARELARIAEATFRDTFESVNSVEDMTLHCQTSYGEHVQAAEIGDPQRTTLLCLEAGIVTGFAQLRWNGAPTCVQADAPGEIQRLYVVRAWHGRGIAPILMAACLEEMKRRGSDAVWLGVWEKNPRAIAFYRKFGFREVGEHVFTLGADRQRDLVMVRPVDMQ